MHRWFLIIVGLIGVFLSGCGGKGTSWTTPTSFGKVLVRMPMPESPNDNQSQISSVTVKVTGPEISTPIVKELEFNPQTNSWEGVFDVPSGIDRLFYVEAKDSAGNVLYKGSAKSDVKPNSLTTVTIHLYIEQGSMGTASISISFDNPYLGIGKIPVCVGHFTKQGQNPNYGSVVPESQIAEQYEIIKKYSNAVRTYSSTHGNEHAAKYAKKYGLKLYLGVWIGSDDSANEAEIESAIQLASQGLVDSIIVGCEVLLRGDKTEEELIDYINRVKSHVSVPVTYAETWGIWWNNGNGRQALANAVDYIMIQCHPYWEKIPNEQAVNHIASAYDKVKSLYPDKKICIGETGWPSDGLANGMAIPSQVNQRRFLTEFVDWARANNVDYFVFEFFDEPWKSGEPYEVGTHWGFFTSDYNIKPEILKVWF
jgi:exo-beta-1,3-glucanase (GH17 family)